MAISGQTDPCTIWRVEQSGVHGYIEKAESPELLLEAIRIVANGGTFFSPIFETVKREQLAQPDAFQKILSNREQEVLRRLAAGDGDEQIGAQLNIAAATVGVHRKHIRGKLGLHNDRELMGYARRWGLI